MGPERDRAQYVFRSLLDTGRPPRLRLRLDGRADGSHPGHLCRGHPRTLDGKNPDGWIPEQKITVEEALRAYTDERRLRRLRRSRTGACSAPATWRIIVLLDRDLTKIPPVDIPNARSWRPSSAGGWSTRRLTGHGLRISWAPVTPGRGYVTALISWRAVRVHWRLSPERGGIRGSRLPGNPSPAIFHRWPPAPRPGEVPRPASTRPTCSTSTG